MVSDSADPSGLDDRLALLDDLEREARRGPVYTRIKKGRFVDDLLSGAVSRRAVAKKLGVTDTAVGYAVRAIRADRLLAEVREEERRSVRCWGWSRTGHRITEDEVAPGSIPGMELCRECEGVRQRDREARDQEPTSQPLYARSGDVVTGSLVTPSPPPGPAPLLAPRPWWEVVRSFLATKRGTGTWCLGWNRDPHEVAELDLGDDGFELCGGCRDEARRDGGQER